MKAKVIILLASLLMMVDFVSAQRGNRISRDIRKVQISQYPKSKDVLNDLYKLRQKSKILNKFTPFGEKDTIFMIEQYGIAPLGYLFSTYWNNTKRILISSDNSGETFNFVTDYTLTKHMIKLVSEWNIEEIRKEEKENGMLSTIGLFATRIILNGNKYKIDCFYFDDFFNLERDQFDYLE